MTGHPLLAALLAGVGCAGVRTPERAPEVPFRMLRHGPDRTSIRYEDPMADPKRALFNRINRDRILYGAPPLVYEPRAALVGDLFCLDAALAGFTGHWDARGRAPYLRWALAGGVDYHVQNAAAYSVSTGTLDRGPVDLLIASHEEMMAESPPSDGHRRTILDPSLTHVGIGLARVGGQFRMTQEFTRVAFEWMELPDRPLQAGASAPFAAKPLSPWAVAYVEIRFEPPPRPLALLELRARRTYQYPSVRRTLRPLLPPGLVYPGRHRGEFEVGGGGRFSLSFPLDAGPGHYFVLCHVRRKPPGDELPRPATAAMITALP